MFKIPGYTHLQKIKIEDRDGQYVENYDLVSKYQRREGLNLICAAQFTKMYESSWKGPKENEKLKPMEKNEKNKFHFVMMPNKDEQGEYLPNAIRISNPFPNGPPFMRKRSQPSALRIHKFNQNADPKKYFFSECLLYIAFREEKEIWERLNGDINKLEQDIQKVKSQVMEYLESNDEARLFVEEATKNDEVGISLDPEGMQEKEDCEIDGQTLHPDFNHLNPDDIDLQESTKTQDNI